MKKSAFKFSSFQEPTLSPFEKLFNIFKELIIHTSGDFDEAIEWLRELDKEYKLTDENYTIDDFVNDLLKKFKDNTSLIKGNSNIILKKIDMSKIDYVFLDGGHDYQTVKNDLNCCREVIVNGGTVLCDDYDLSYAPGVKTAIDEFSLEHGLKCTIICNDRFAKIEKN